jgi:small subunit ribosomal protein S6
MSAQRQYELVYVVHPDTSEQELADLHGQIEAIAQKFSGRVERTEPWGRKRLAYEIAHQKEGIYVLELLEGSGEMVKEIDRRLKVSDRVLRHLVVRVDEEVRVAERRRAERQAHVARRRAARGAAPEAAAAAAATPAVEAGGPEDQAGGQR